MIIWMIFFLLLWWLYFYDEQDFKLAYTQFTQLIVEKEYVTILRHNNKEPAVFLKFRIISALIVFLLYHVYYLNNLTIMRVIISFLLLIGVYKFLYWQEIKKYEKKLLLASQQFPYYLNTLTMLVASNPVVNALYDSIEEAPQVFVDDLYILVKEIHTGVKQGIKPYLDFADKYQTINGLRKLMCTLYNMNATVADSQIILTSLCKLANEKVNAAQKQRLNNNLDKQALMPWLGFFWIGFVLIKLFTKFNLTTIGVS